MDKEFICFNCYKFHPEMRGISEDEFVGSKRYCQQEKCNCRGKELQAAEYCKDCEKMFPYDSHRHQ